MFDALWETRLPLCCSRCTQSRERAGHAAVIPLTSGLGETATHAPSPKMATISARPATAPLMTNVMSRSTSAQPLAGLNV